MYATALVRAATGRWLAATGRQSRHDARSTPSATPSSTGAPGERDRRAAAARDAYRGALVQADEQEMFAGLAVGRQGPAQVAPRRATCPLPELAPDEAYVAVMASARSTSTRCGRRSSSRCPRSASSKRLGKESVWGARHDQPYHVVGSDALGRRAAGRLGGAQLEAGRPGHRALQLRRRPGPVRARRLDAGDQPAHLGLRDQLRRPRRPRAW